MARFVVFDVETPNARNHRMSAIGICVVEGQAIVESCSTLIDPETHFDPFNSMLTGITADMVRDAPDFRTLWREIGPLMQSGILIAHNAVFDMRVLSRCLMDYEIDVPQFADYACTVQMGRRCHPELADHKLDTMCDALGIGLDHHRADSDSRACAELLLDYMRRGLEVGDFLRRYDLWHGCSVKPELRQKRGSKALNR